MPRRTPCFLRSLLLLILLAGLSAPAPRTHAQQDALPDMRWVSPTWDYTIRWFSNEWSVTEDSASEGDDVLALTDTLGNYVAFLGTTDFGGDAEACLDWILADTQAQPGNTDFRLALDATGEPYAYSSPAQAYAVFAMSVQAADGVPRDFAGYIECQTLVPGEAVLERVYLGPPEVFDQWYDDIVDTLEGVFPPPSAWTPYFEDDPAYVSAGLAPLRGEARDNAGVLLDEADQPQVLIGLEAEAGATRVVSFTNLSAHPVTVVPANISLLLTTLTLEVEDQSLPASAVRWEDGTATAADGSRVLAPGERAAALLDFGNVDLTVVNCDMLPFLELIYNLPNGAYTEFAFSALPDSLGDCITGVPPQPATGRPVFAPASTLPPPEPSAVTREPLLAEMDGQLDHLGRIPLVRITIPPGATFADLPSSPLAMFVESGAVEVLLDNISIPIPADEQITAETGTGLIMRTGDDVGATLLLLVQSPPPDWTESLVDDPLEQLEVELLFPEQELLERSAERQFTIDRVLLPPGSSLELGDAAGTMPESFALLVESGNVVVSDPAQPSGIATAVAPGESLRLLPGTTIEAAADQAAELLLVEALAAAPASATPPSGQTNALADTSYTSPTWGYTIRWDADEWSIGQETSENGTDLLTLHDDAGNIAAFMGNSGYGGNATACLESMKASVWQVPGATGYALTMNELNEPFELRGPTQAYAFYQLRLPDDAGGMEETYFYDECQTLVPGEAVFQRSYFGPAAVYWERQSAIIAVLESVFLPASAWIAQMAPFDPGLEYGSAGQSPLLGQLTSRDNATIVHDDMGNPTFLVGLLDEAGDTRLVHFENLGDTPVLVEPEKIVLTLAPRADPAAEEMLPLLSVAWQDGTPANADGSRSLAVGERATALLTFAPPQSDMEACQDKAFTTLIYPWPNEANEERGFFGYGDLPACAQASGSANRALSDETRWLILAVAALLSARDDLA